ncbi:MAG: nucleotidyl transferase AbiEii/AbiGii toxin family protein [Simkaniaceae bacterium]|nr:nucleotidyl transferase AbiEii/AbiGii toxin family protein [Candidatus Sacchlamyda saccharinae]
MMNQQALKDRLQAIAKEKNIPFNACWKQFLLERFLTRLSGSEYVERFIFKGGFLLAYLMHIGRETTDLDFLLTRMNAREKELETAFREISSVFSDDGFSFSLDGIKPLNQPHMLYPGYRVSLHATFAKMRDKIQVDVGVGDIVQPLNRQIPLLQYRGKPFFEDSISLNVYPVETIFSEKLETILSKGASNSRMKDYHDLMLLIRKKEMLNINKLKNSVSNTFSKRETPLRQIAFSQTSLESIQKLWKAHLQGLGDVAQELNLPSEISDVIQEINQYISRSLKVENSTLISQ